MLRLHANVLDKDWRTLLKAILDDLKPLGVYYHEDKNQFEIGSRAPLTRAGQKAFWDEAHLQRYRQIVREPVTWKFIQAFEAQARSIFVDPTDFLPSRVQPYVETVDWKDPFHSDLVEYLRLSQKTVSRKFVGRRMGLLVWDEGQPNQRPLIGAAILASPRYSQGARDHFLGWPPAYHQNHPRFSSAERQRRQLGLARMMQLSVVFAQPPYNILNAVRYIALLPLTAYGAQAFSQACRSADSDLIGVTTTTGFDLTGAPVQKQRVAQLSDGNWQSLSKKGNVFVRLPDPPDKPPLRARFEDLLKPNTIELASKLFARDNPMAFSKAANPAQSAVSYALRVLGLHRSIFDGNAMGVHLAVLGQGSLDHLRNGTIRPQKDRHLIDFDTLTSNWLLDFCQPEAGLSIRADKGSREAYLRKRDQRATDAMSLNPRYYRLSARM